jgi:hypothetical protein
VIIVTKTSSNDPTNDSFVPDRVVRAELSIAPMTLWRWDRNPALAELGWPPPMRVRGGRRKFRSRKQLEFFKQNMLQRAIAARGEPSQKTGNGDAGQCR